MQLYSLTMNGNFHSKLARLLLAFTVVAFPMLAADIAAAGEKCSALFEGSAESAQRSPWFPDAQLLFRGIKVTGDVDANRFFSARRVVTMFPADPVKMRDLIVRHKDGLRSQGDGIVSTSTALAVATMFSDTTYSGGTGLILKIKTPFNAVSLNKYADAAKGKPYDHGSLHGFEYENEVIIPEHVAGEDIVEIMQVVPSGDPNKLAPKAHNSLNYPFAIKSWVRDSEGHIIERRIDPPVRLPIYYNGQEQ